MNRLALLTVLVVVLLATLLLSTGALTNLQAAAQAQPVVMPVTTPTGTPTPTDTPTETSVPPVFLPLVGRPPDTPTPTQIATPTTTPTNTPVATVADPAAEIRIPAGNFQMGCDSSNDTCFSDEVPLHTVFLHTYYIDKYEVTHGRYAACAAAGACPPHSCSALDCDPYYPVSRKWYDAQTFCEWEGKRLPSEAEWEKAARGSRDTRIYPWGNEPPDCTRLNFNDCVGDMVRVGSYPSGASPYGAMDMAGNAWEWVNDWYQEDYYTISPSSNPPGPTRGDDRVLRGGAYHNPERRVRIASRGHYYPTAELSFRCARTP